MRRALATSIGLLSIASILHCGSSSTRAFDEDAPDGGGTAQDAASPPAFGDAGGPGDANPNACTEDIDVVLVLDVSSSMGFVLDKLDTEITKVVSASNALKAGAHFGLVVFVDNVKLYATGDQGGGKIHTAGATLSAAFKDAKATYTTPNRNPGDGPTGPTTQNPICEENALDALHDAATDFPWRPNTARIAIVVTDDTFLERPDNYGDRDGDGMTNKLDFPREGNYPARFTVDETVAALKKETIRVFSFTRLTPPGFLDPTACGTGRRHTTDDCITFGWSKPYKGKAPIPTATGGKNFDLDEVRSGKVSLADTINDVVLQSHCAGPPK
jgi:hypothetical protein